MCLAYWGAGAEGHTQATLASRVTPRDGFKNRDAHIQVEVVAATAQIAVASADIASADIAITMSVLRAR